MTCEVIVLLSFLVPGWLRIIYEESSVRVGLVFLIKYSNILKVQ